MGQSKFALGQIIFDRRKANLLWGKANLLWGKAIIPPSQIDSKG